MLKITNLAIILLMLCSCADKNKNDIPSLFAQWEN